MVSILDPEVVLRDAVDAAGMAPSVYNTQPWRFELGDRTLDLLADRARHLTAIDPQGRLLVQSCGCALFNARVAVRAMGYADEVTVIFVDHDRPEHLATLCLGDRYVPSHRDRELMRAIGLRTTNRRELLDRPVALEHTDELAALAAEEGVKLVRLDPEHKSVLGELIARADERTLTDPSQRDEIARWLVPRHAHRDDGIPEVEKEYSVRELRSPAIGHTFGELEQARVAAAPVVLVMGTPDDDVASWLACGQALEAVLLRATALGLSAAFMNQLLEDPSARLSVAALVPGIGYPQMVLRLGVAAEPIEQRSRRRDFAALIET